MEVSEHDRWKAREWNSRTILETFTVQFGLVNRLDRYAGASYLSITAVHFPNGEAAVKKIVAYDLGDLDLER